MSSLTDGLNAAEIGVMLKLCFKQLEVMKTDSATKDNPALIASKEKEISDLSRAIAEAATNITAIPSTKGVSGQDYESNQTRNWIHNRVLAINSFKGTGPNELSGFIENLTQVFDLFVKFNTKHETMFVEVCKAQLGSNIYANLVSSKTPIATFNDLTKWLRRTYDSQLTTYQLMGSAWDAEFQAKEPYIAFAQTVEKSLRTASDFIFEDFRKKNNGDDMSAQQVIDLVGGMLMCEKLKAHNTMIYRAMVTQMNELTSASEVATYAESLRVRYGCESLTDSQPDVFYGNRPDNKRPSNPRFNNDRPNVKPHGDGNNQKYRDEQENCENDDDDETMTIKKSKFNEYLKKATNLNKPSERPAPRKYGYNRNRNQRNQPQSRPPVKNNQTDKAFVEGQNMDNTVDNMLKDIMNDRDFQQ